MLGVVFSVSAGAAWSSQNRTAKQVLIVEIQTHELDDLLNFCWQAFDLRY